MFIYTFHSVHLPPLSAGLEEGGGDLNLQPNFQKKGEAWHDLNFQRGITGKEEGALHKLKSGIFNDKKCLGAKIFFSVIQTGKF